MRRIVPAVTILALALAGCGTVLNASRSTPKTLSVLKAKAARAGAVEQSVDRDRIAASMLILTGKQPAAPGVSIPERGTVDGRSLTRRFITETLTARGYKVETHKYRNNGENIIAKLPATEGTSNEWILVGAHMDSVRNAGADDNGSGRAAVLEAATVMRNLPGRKQNIMFCWFDEEELGLVGSYAMAKDFKKQGLKITSVHTVDMIGYDADKDRKIEIEQPDGPLWGYYQMVNKTHELNFPLARTSSGSTDHVAWRETGFPAVGLCEEWVGGDTTPHYHRKSDTYENIDVDFIAAGAKLMAAATGDLACGIPAPATTRFIPHSQFPGRDRHCGTDLHKH
jgi:Zn-dependent M28 family amino/carboxypeptidase